MTNQARLDSIVNVLSDAVHTATHTNCKTPARTMTQVEVDAFRDDYLATMEAWEAAPQDSDSQAAAWAVVRGRFQTIVDAVLNRLGENHDEANEAKEAKEAEVPEGECKDVTLRVRGKNYVMEKNCTCKTIGRVLLNDIALDEHSSKTSRLHAIVLRFDRLLVILDVGSLYGIECRERSNQEAPLEKSDKRERRPLTIADDEVAVFLLGDESLTVNPKECVIMSAQCTGTRNFQAQCGHFICCVECARAWQRDKPDDAVVPCPVCREPFFGTNAVLNAEHVRTAYNRQ